MEGGFPTTTGCGFVRICGDLFDLKGSNPADSNGEGGICAGPHCGPFTPAPAKRFTGPFADRGGGIPLHVSKKVPPFGSTFFETEKEGFEPSRRVNDLHP